MEKELFCNEYLEALEDYSAGNKKSAFQKCLIAANEKKDINALNLLGIFYFNGFGTKKDVEKGIECFKNTIDHESADGNRISLDEGIYNLLIAHYNKSEMLSWLNWEAKSVPCYRISDDGLRETARNLRLMEEGEFFASNDNVGSMMSLWSLKTTFFYRGKDNDRKEIQVR